MAASACSGQTTGSNEQIASCKCNNSETLCCKCDGNETSSCSRMAGHVAAVAFVGLLFYKFILWLIVEHNRCEMTFMYNYPKFIELNVTADSSSGGGDTDEFSNYRMIVYGEAKYAESLRPPNGSYNGVPVLFIPGNAGSDKQVRSLGSVSYLKTHMRRNGPKQMFTDSVPEFNYFSVDFDEELSGVQGASLRRQTAYVVRVVARILALYGGRQPLVIVGHSMGGLVARALFMHPDFNASAVPLIITLATPHLQAPIAFDQNIVSYVAAVNAHWTRHARDYAHVTLVSIAGGAADQLVPAHLTQFDRHLQAVPNGPQLHWLITTSMPRVWAASDHLCIVWCNQLIRLLTRCLFEMVDGRAQMVSPARRRVLLDVHLNVALHVTRPWHNNNSSLQPVPDRAVVRELPNATLSTFRLHGLRRRRQLYAVANGAREHAFLFACRNRRCQGPVEPMPSHTVLAGTGHTHLSLYCSSAQRLRRSLPRARYAGVYVHNASQLFIGSCATRHHSLAVRDHGHVWYNPWWTWHTNDAWVQPEPDVTTTVVDVRLPGVLASHLHAYTLLLRPDCLPNRTSHDYATVWLRHDRKHRHLDQMAAFSYWGNASSQQPMWLYRHTLGQGPAPDPLLRLYLHNNCRYTLSLRAQPVKLLQYHLAVLPSLCVVFACAVLCGCVVCGLIGLTGHACSLAVVPAVGVTAHFLQRKYAFYEWPILLLPATQVHYNRTLAPPEVCVLVASVLCVWALCCLLTRLLVMCFALLHCLPMRAKSAVHSLLTCLVWLAACLALLPVCGWFVLPVGQLWLLSRHQQPGATGPDTASVYSQAAGLLLCATGSPSLVTWATDKRKWLYVFTVDNPSRLPALLYLVGLVWQAGPLAPSPRAARLARLFGLVLSACCIGRLLSDGSFVLSDLCCLLSLCMTAHTLGTTTAAASASRQGAVDSKQKPSVEQAQNGTTRGDHKKNN